MESKRNIKSLSEELSHIVNPEPVFIDPEDDIHVESSAKNIFKTITDNENDLNINDNNISVLRRKRTQILSDVDKRYSGKKVNRKTLEDSDESDLDESEEDLSENFDNNSDDSEVIEFYSDNIRAPIASIDEYDEGVIDTDSHSSRDSFGKESDDQNVSDEDLNEEKADLKLNDMNEEYINQFSNIDVSDEIAKGIAVKNQLLIWDNLLETRIKLQKLLIESNKFPQFDCLPVIKKSGDSGLNNTLKETKKAVKKLLTVLIDIDESLNSQNSLITNDTQVSDSKSNEEITSDEEMEGKESSVNLNEEIKLKRKFTDSELPEFLSKRHCDLASVRNEIIDKWYEKTRYSSGNIKQKSFSAFEQSATKQIEHILSDRQRLIKRSQTKRSLYEIIGKNVETNESNDEMSGENIPKNSNKETDTEIFDDDDFYHQLLRELIERKTNSDANDPMAISKKWIEIQKLRNKMKRKIDTKASKGRKVRYDVHSKLINFMAPIDYSTYTEEAKNELFSSLFGKKCD